MSVRSTILAGVMLSAIAGTCAAADGPEVPPPFAPFEYLIGSWKGSGVPTANRIKGWPETHAWAWKFEKGSPVGLTVTMSGDKLLTKGQVAYAADFRRYALTGIGADGKPVTFTGALDASGKQLTLDRVGALSNGSKQRLTLYPNASFIRYTLRVTEQEPGAPQYKPTIVIGLTKEGEAFASGGSATDLPKCVVTGGAATMTVSFQGKTFPLCCTGCRDEFNDNPEKYIKKAALLAATAKTSVKTVTSTKDDGAFDGLIDEPKKAAMPASKSKAAVVGVEKEKPAAGKTADPLARAASLLKLGQNLEKAGKTAPALGYYRQIVKDFPATASASSAAARIKALAGK